MFLKWISACICCLILFSGWTIGKKRLAAFLCLYICKIFTIDKVLPYYFSPYFLLKTSELRLLHFIMGVCNRYDGLDFVLATWSAGDMEDWMIIFWCDGQICACFYGYYFKNCNYGQMVCGESVICIQFLVIVIIKFLKFRI